jgi:glutaredoxin
MLERTHVAGKEVVPVMLYTLSTCGWCKKTKALLGELGVAYDYVDVDLLAPDEAAKALEDVLKWNPSCSFPTIVVGEKDCIIGYQEEKIRGLVNP